MNNIFVTKPYLPPQEEYQALLPNLWDSRHLTNAGVYHQKLEDELKSLFVADSVSLVNNGTIALEIAIQAMGLKGKVITTPYSFVATANSILLKGLEPVFIDIEDNGFNLEPELIEDACDAQTSAIMPVHVYGLPCQNKTIQEIADRKGLQIIYDAAHAFGIKENGESILNWGDVSTLSFHATKVFHTFEGGAIVSPHSELKKSIDSLRSFGFEDEDVVALGTNAKMNEAQAAMGLVLLRHLDNIIGLRKKWHELYIELLRGIEGITLLNIPPNLEHNYAYFPILINKPYPLTRDQLYDKFTEQNIFPRKYFYPLITDFSLYKNYSILSKHKIPNARRVADSVLCLPLYPDLTEKDVERICKVLSA
ncbi:MAG: DegT/DnrJ/EryC1/StrS family aminotransferase [Candidatus Cloacimonetes bacterium]|nr:DegT/DnrJ/EryC1/StrS family aminotransferase [Candidatus Cloacimonadota bacterium]